MGRIAEFIIRLVGYAFVLGVVARIAESLWIARGLDGVFELQPYHDTALAAFVVAPIVLALVGVGLLRPVAIFVAAFLCGAALAAPFALARLAGG